MTDAVIVSTARTPIGKAYRGALNATEGATLLGHAIGEAVARAKVDPKEVEDVVMGAALQQGSTGGNIARKALLRAGANSFTLDELKAFLAGKLGKHEIPAALDFVDELPRTSVGKLSRHELRQQSASRPAPLKTPQLATGGHS